MNKETITFTNKAEMRKGFALIWQGVKTAVAAIGRIIDAVVHHYPYPFIFATILVAAVLSIYNIGLARAERDKLNRENYELQQKLTSITNEMEAGGEAQCLR